MFSYKYNFNTTRVITKSSGTIIAESKDEDNMYISNNDEFEEVELITYLEEKRADKKVNFIYISL